LRTSSKIAIQCGLLVIPARLGVVVPSSETSMFHQIHTGCGGRIRQKRACELCREPVEWADVGVGAEVPGTDVLVEVTVEELAALKDWDAKTLRVVQFTPAGQIDPLLYGDAYRLSPGHDAASRAPSMRAAALLRDAMTVSGVVAVCRLDRHLAVLEVRDDEFLVTKLAWPAMLRPADQDTAIDPAMGPRPQELKMATQLIGSMTGPWQPGDHADTYREAVAELLAGKAAGTGMVPAPARAGAGPAADMMAVLQQSIAAVKAEAAEAKTAAPRARRKAS
jgi:DNA end-binding protein Ku